ncbi:group II intron reverse transcriptase/maturase [Soehngenia saccharolytica]|nr:group II intron reverse transcriptase/maturase [Soehngenia saccharolytica]
MNAKANNTNEKVRKLQRKLYLVAKENSKRRFHALFDKVYRLDILKEAWKRVKANGGAGGIDKITIDDVKAYGEDNFLNEIHHELIMGKYHPRPVKRTYIPKGKTGRRPLGIPVIKDRVIQMAVKIVIEPIFEADFKDCSYGFRPKRNAHQALDRVRKDTANKGWWVVDADIRGYFDNINHEKLMILVERRISDRRILKIIRKWLKAGIIDKNEFKESEIGSPQGGVISPLLANIYLHYLDFKWDLYYSHLGKLTRYCDDFVIVSRTKKEAEHALEAVKDIMRRLELELHEEKTKLINMWDGKEGFDFLGFHHRRKKTETSKGQIFNETHQFPSKKAMQKIRDNIKDVFASRAKLRLNIEDMIDILNPKVVGMRNYYGLKNAGKQLNKIDWFIIKKFTLWHNYRTQNNRRYSGISKVRQLTYGKGLKKLAV